MFKGVKLLSSQIIGSTGRRSAIHFSSSCQITVRKYTPQHEWVDYDYDEKTARIGISYLGVKIIGQIAIGIPRLTGEYLKRGDPFVQVIGQHYTAELISPFNTEILAVNDYWRRQGSILTLDVENEDNWFITVNLNDVKQQEKFESLLTKEAYEQRYANFLGEDTKPLLNVD